MGNACCSVESQEPGTESALKNFMKRAESQGLPIRVVLQDGNDLSCTLVLDMNTHSFVIRSGEKKRVVPFNTIKNVLATPQQLARVDTRRDLTSDPVAVGLHLYKAESCIPLRMETEDDKYNLVETLKLFGIPPPKSKKPEESHTAS